MSSWWVKNRKKVLLGGLLGGAGLAAIGPGPLAGLLGGGEGAGALAAAKAAGTVGGVGPLASGVEYGALMGGTNPMMASAMGMADKGLGALSGMSKGMGMAQMAMEQPQQPMAPPPPQQPQIQQPTQAGYGGGMPQELQGLPPDHPAVIEWKKKQGGGYGYV